jgi:lipopolysaccharide transport system ATP-binding protein
MKPTVISIKNLGKRYVLGHQRSPNDGVRHVIEAAIRSPLKMLRERRERKQQEHEEFWALKNISFDVKQGEVVGLIGSNGAGKSTMLKLLSRITEPTEGSIHMRGRAAALLEVGTGFHPELTGRENIFLNGAILGMGKAEIKRKFDEIVAFSEIEKFLDTPVKRYSSGMYVRLAFSVAAHLEPDILIVDEVLAVGDVSFQKKCLAKMQEARARQQTVLFVSHNIAAVEAFCTRGVVFSKGRAIYDAPVKEALQYYLDSLRGFRPPCYGNDIDLSASGGRPAHCHSQLKRVRLFDLNGNPLENGVPSAGGLKAIIDVELEKPCERVDAELSFFTMNGERVCTAHSAYQPGHNRGEMSGWQTFTCEIPQLPLIPGEYKLHVGLDVGLNEVDCVDDAARLQITPTDHYGTGVSPTLGMFLLNNRWSVTGTK